MRFFSGGSLFFSAVTPTSILAHIESKNETRILTGRFLRIHLPAKVLHRHMSASFVRVTFLLFFPQEERNNLLISDIRLES
jgi:hypothetical protein